MAQCRDAGGVVASCLAVVVLGSAIGTLIASFIPSATPVPGADCYRPCIAGERRACSFEMTVHRYQTLSRACLDCPDTLAHCSLPHCVSGNGVKRLITVANWQLPGPAMHVCEGDTLHLKVRNALPSSTVSLHWHGLSSSSHAPFSSSSSGGPPSLVLIPPHQEHSMTLTSLKPGTHYWHSAAGFDSGDGLFGPVVVRQPSISEPHTSLYDYDLPEHTIMINDWLHVPTGEVFTLHYHSGVDHYPYDLLINGRGRYKRENSTPLSKKAPEAVFTVQEGKRYRLRLISATFSNCPVEVSVSRHLLTIIATDGAPIQPYNATHLILQPGERWDVVLKADQSPASYWIMFRGLRDCVANDVSQRAVLLYNQHQGHIDLDHKTEPLSGDYGAFRQDVNPLSGECTLGSTCLTSLQSIDPLPTDLNNTTADLTLYLEFNLRVLNNPRYYDPHLYAASQGGWGQSMAVPTPQINNLSFSSLPNTLMPSGHRSLIPPSDVCGSQQPHQCSREYCECVHMRTIPLDSVVDIILVDKGGNVNEGQSVHLQGHSFRVLGQGQLPSDAYDNGVLNEDNVVRLHRTGLLNEGSSNPVVKDTVLVPHAGYTLIRFKATNAGYWSLHSQLLFHWAGGMSLLLKVGEDYDMASPPSSADWCSSS